MIPTWIKANTALLGWLGALSVVMFVGSLIAIPLLVIRIPTHYFMHPPRVGRGRSLSRLLGAVVKNVLGVIFILAGLAMLVLPGQGIITILIGLMLMNFPGKRNLELRLVQQAPVYRTLNWMRAKANRPPLRIPGVDVPTA